MTGWKNWAAEYKPRHREGSMTEETKYAMIEHPQKVPQQVRYCWEHGDNCPHVAGECPSMHKNNQVFSVDPIEAEVIPYVYGVTDGHCVVSVFVDSDVPAEFN